MYPFPDMSAPDDAYLALALETHRRLLDVAARVRQHWTNHAATLGLTAAQVKVLLQLTPGEPTPMRRLAQQLSFDASNLTTLVDRLVARGALERRPDPADRRVKALLLTEEGERLRGQFWRSLTADAGPVAPLGEAELRTLTALLAAIDQPAQ